MSALTAVAPAFQMLAGGVQTALGFSSAGAQRKFADIEEQLGRERAQRYAEAARRMVGVQRAAYAAGGVDVNRGTPVDLMAETAFEHAYNEAYIRYAAELDAERRRQGAQAAAIQGIAKGLGSAIGGLEPFLNRPQTERLDVSRSPEFTTPEQPYHWADNVLDVDLLGMP